MSEATPTDQNDGSPERQTWETPRVIVERAAQTKTHKVKDQNYDYTANSGPLS